MYVEKRSGGTMVPAAALVAALLYLAGLALPSLLPAAVVACMLGGCAIALVRRPAPGLRLAIAAIAVWLIVALGGAFLLRHHSLAGATWALLVIYALPLPFVPWLYARTFPSEQDVESAPSCEPRTPDPGLPT
jgi:hypothetical protein